MKTANHLNVPLVQLWLAVALLLGVFLPVQAQPQYLYSTNGATWGWRADFAPSAGAQFQVGTNDVIVTHLGYFDKDEDGLSNAHPVGIYGPPLGTGNLLAEVSVPAGTGAFYTNGFRWVQLAIPLVLKAGSNYIVCAQNPDTTNASDAWPNLFTPAWNTNTWLAGTTNGSRVGTYANPGAWPTEPLNNYSWQANKTYGCANAAYFPSGLFIGTQPQPATRYMTESVTFNIVAAGATGYQWYKAPSTLLAGENSPTLTRSNLTLADAGNYYCKATNLTSSLTSDNASLTVVAWTAPAFVQSPVSLTAYIHQSVSFSGTVTGSPVGTINYQWRKGVTDLPGQTNSTLTLVNLSPGAAGTYTLVAANSLGTNSAAATLSVITPVAGTYEAVALDAQPVVYYRFSNLATSSSIVNEGTFGPAANGTAESVDVLAFPAGGPQPPTFPNFENSNVAMKMDGFSADAKIPAMNLNTNTVTMVAWINPDPSQIAYSGIVYYRGVGGASGLILKQNAGGDNMLGYTWADNYWDFKSNLLLTSNAWNFVALVIQPGLATLYVQDGAGMKSTNQVIATPNVAFSGVTEIGWDSLNSGTISYDRRFTGGMDEVMVFNRSLSPNEIYSLFAASSNYPPVIVTNPQSTTNDSGTAFSLNVTAFGTPALTFQWYKQGSGALGGATNTNYSVASAALSSGGNYYAVVTNNFGQATSAVATVTVLQKTPDFTLLPVAVTTWLGESATFSAAAIGSLPLTNQWFKGISLLTGQTNPSLVLTNLQPGDAGAYYVRVSNSVGQTNSPAVTLTLDDPQQSFQMLYSTNGMGTLRSNVPGILGATFRTGAANRRVTHLGYFDDVADGLSASHQVGIYTKGEPPGTGTLLVEVSVPPGTSSVYSNGYRWVALSSPLTLQANTYYVIAASTNNVPTDAWPEGFVPAWNSAYVGSTTMTNRYLMFDDPVEVAWPHEPSNTGIGWGDNRTFGAYNLANFPSSAAPVAITINRVGNNLQLSWPSGVLYQADDVNGTYTAVPGATSPWPVTPSAARKFYLLRAL